MNNWKDWIPVAILVATAIGGFYTLKQEVGDMRDDMNRRFNQVDARLDRMNVRLERIEQNHLDHITQLHTTASSAP